MFLYVRVGEQKVIATEQNCHIWNFYVKQVVIVFTHVPIQPGAQGRICGLMCLVWNYDEVLGIMDKYTANIKVVFSGHDHNGGYACRRGVHHVTLPGFRNLCEFSDFNSFFLFMSGVKFPKAVVGFISPIHCPNYYVVTVTRCYRDENWRCFI